jgi:hypothetical protein
MEKLDLDQEVGSSMNVSISDLDHELTAQHRPNTIVL